MSASVHSMATWCPKCKAMTGIAGRCVVCEHDGLKDLENAQQRVRSRRRRYRLRRFVVDHFPALAVLSILASGALYIAVVLWARS